MHTCFIQGFVDAHPLTLGSMKTSVVVCEKALHIFIVLQNFLKTYSDALNNQRCYKGSLLFDTSEKLVFFKLLLQNQMSQINTLKCLSEDTYLPLEQTLRIQKVAPCCPSCLPKRSHSSSHHTHHIPSNRFHLVECPGSVSNEQQLHAGAQLTSLCESSDNFYCMLTRASFVICPLEGIHSLFSDWLG